MTRAKNMEPLKEDAEHNEIVNESNSKNWNKNHWNRTRIRTRAKAGAKARA